jgi:uncharacterized damage-inducible protein DinB
MLPYFAVLARYHAWATRRLHEQVDALSDAEYRRDVGLFFRSVHGTLNHLLVADSLWYGRFAEGRSMPLALDAELEAARVRLRERSFESVDRWCPLIAAWPASRFDATTLDYTSTQGVALSLPFVATLGHVFNHGTHHRGQITAAITAMGRAGPVLDLARMLVEERERAPS